MESSQMPRSKSRKSTKTNTMPLPSVLDVVGASTDTRGFTARLFGKWNRKDAFVNSRKHSHETYNNFTLVQAVRGDLA
jgi:hypothetical protein